MMAVEGSTDKQTRLIAYDDPDTLMETSGVPCLTETTPHTHTIDVLAHSAMSQGSWYHQV